LTEMGEEMNGDKVILHGRSERTKLHLYNLHSIPHTICNIAMHVLYAMISKRLIH
jgi:hypothetical protein